MGLIAALQPSAAAAHAGLAAADPAPGATLGATPEGVTLSFSEQPEASLSSIEVLGPRGDAVQKGEAKPVEGDPLALGVPVPRLPRGVYTVSWKVVSAVDGHATDGTYAFGVRASPRGGAATTGTATPASSPLELVARIAFLAGIFALLGGAVAAVARFGGSSGSDLKLAAAGWVAAVAGLLLLAEAQRRSAGSSFSDLLDTGVGEALIQRGVALALAGVALLVAWRLPRRRRPALALAALAALAAIVAHAAASHAAAGDWPVFPTVAAQATHFAAAAVWFGGLAALLLGLRGAMPAERGAALRRFAAVALVALVAVLVTGTLRAVDELGSWGDLLDSGYGRAVLAKAGLIGLIVFLAVRNRRHGVPAAAGGDLAPLRRNSRWELALAGAALVLAALLGTLAPPAPAGQALGLTVEGTDFGTTVRVELTTASDQPGPNLFVAEVEDYDSGEPVEGARVSLRFTPLDDPWVEPSTLRLAARADGAYAGSGANLGFDGRWGVEAEVEGAAGTVTVPLELELPGPENFVSVLRIPGRSPKYTMQIGTVGNIRIEPHPERPGPARLYVTCFTPFGSTSRVEEMVVTLTGGDRPLRQLPLRRLDSGRFVAAVVFEPGPARVGVVARTRDGTRLRGVFAIEIPAE